MQSIPLTAQSASVLDVKRLLQRLSTVREDRHAKGRRYPLASVLLLVGLAKRAGQDRPRAIADWVTHRAEPLRRLLRRSWQRMPHHSTYRRLLQTAVGAAERDRLVGEECQSLPVWATAPS